MNSWISMATTFQEMVDCRMVQLELEFHQVARKQLVELAQLCANESSRLLSEKCYCQWKYNGRRKSFSALLKRIESSNASFDFDFEADVLSEWFTIRIPSEDMTNRFNWDATDGGIRMCPGTIMNISGSGLPTYRIPENIKKLSCGF